MIVRKLPDIELTDEPEETPEPYTPAEWYRAIWGYLCWLVLILFFLLSGVVK